jgi:hypothetical protein
MKALVKTKTVLLLITLALSYSLAACASDPAPQNDPYNDADSQRSRADKTQDELSRETK